MPNVDQRAQDIAIEGAPLANVGMSAAQGISPIIELLMSILGQSQQPTKAFKSSEMTQPYMGPRANPQTGQPEQRPLKGQIMGQPPQY